MQAFVNCSDYYDYLNVIKNSDIKKTKIYDENKNGLDYLYSFEEKEEQAKIIKIFKLIDSELSYNGSKDNEMFKKINYILSTGVLFHDYKDYIKELDSNEIFTLIFGEYSRVDKSNKMLLPIFTNKELLDTIISKYNNDLENKIVNVFGISDFFFMIKEYYAKNQFDVNNREMKTIFINQMIDKINTNSLHKEVDNMLEYWNSEEMDELRKKVI